MTEGDIYLDKSTKLILDELKDLGRDAITNPVFHWPGGRVPYTFGPVGKLQLYIVYQLPSCNIAYTL